MYSGDANFKGSTGTVSQTVNKAPVTLTAAGPETVTVNTSVSLTAQVLPAGSQVAGTSAPGGTVTFLDTTTGKTLGTASVDSSGNVVLQYKFKTTGQQQITVTYNGDGNYQSISVTLYLDVT